MAVQSVMSPTVGQSGRPGTPGSFLMTTMCGLRVGMGLRVAWPFCRDVTECWPEWPIGNAWSLNIPEANIPESEYPKRLCPRVSTPEGEHARA